MGKSVVLKDLSKRIAGYVHACETGIVCRVQLDAPAELTVLFSDGQHRTFAVDQSAQEQRFACECRMMRGCYVSRGDELLLVSDQAMCEAFAKKTSCGKKTIKSEEASGPRAQAQPDIHPAQEKKRAACEMRFPQRRWPPPVCWDSAQYRQGRWEER